LGARWARGMQTYTCSPDLMSKEKQKIEWIDCPICGKPDMRKEYSLHGGSPIIFCANHACGSNGGNNFSAVPNINPEQPPESNIKRFHACVVDGDEVCNCVLDKDGEFTRSDCTIAEGDESILSREDCVNWQLVEHLDESVEVQQLKADNLTFKSMLESTQDREAGYKEEVSELQQDLIDRDNKIDELEAEIAKLKAELRGADIQFKELSEITEALVARLEKLEPEEEGGDNTEQKYNEEKESEKTICSAQGFCRDFDGEACLVKECRGKPIRRKGE